MHTFLKQLWEEIVKFIRSTESESLEVGLGIVYSEIPPCDFENQPGSETTGLIYLHFTEKHCITLLSYLYDSYDPIK